MSYELFCSGEVTSGMGIVWYRRVLVMWCFAEFCTGIVLWGDGVVKCCEVQCG